MSSPLQFKNAHSLHYAAQEGILPPAILQAIESGDVRTLYVLDPGRASDFKKLAKKHGCTFVALTAQVLDDWPRLSRLIHDLHRSISTAGAALLYSPSEARNAVFFLAAFLSASAARLDVHTAVKVLGGTDAENETRLLRYAAYLDREPVPEVRPRFTIRTKLLGMTAVIIVTSLVSVTLLATSLFKKTSETMIQEYNLSLARLIGNKARTDLEGILYRAEQLVVSGKKGTEFFRENPGIRWVKPLGKPALWSGADPVLPPGETMPSSLVLRREPGGLLLLSGPVADPAVRSLTVAFEPAVLLATFEGTRQTSLFELFVVDEQGKLLVSTGAADADLKDLPIVQQMLSSANDNGSQRYTHKGIGYMASFQHIGGAGLGVVSVVEEDRVFEDVDRIQRQNFRLTVLILCLAILGVFYFSRTLTIPIVRLAGAMRRVERGEYHVELAAGPKDEVGSLTASFLSMARGLEEREKIREAFGRFVHEEIARRALKGEVKLGGEKKRVAIFFSDLRNFTGISEKLQPEKVVDFLNEYFSEMVECIYETHGVVDKFIGDAIMAHWGAFRTHGNDTVNAIQAALLMRGRLHRLNSRLQGKGLPPLQQGCGINTGDVIAGQIGSRKRLEYTVIGDAVNLASRIEYLNKAFGTDILVSEESMREVPAIFRSIQLPPVQIRGKAEPQIVHAILGRADDPSAPASLEDLRRFLGMSFDEQQAAKILETPSDRIIRDGNQKPNS